ncbi:MAG: NUDIX hydrolase [Betaproteobacteria bacterium]|nr:NUDIX hydrolase [Betaproteobacteria bacterium]
MTYTEQRQEGKRAHVWAVRVRMLIVRFWLRFFAPRWNVGVLAVIRDAQGRVCLLRHKGRVKPWGLPGGLAAWPESPECALLRELCEELDWVIVSQRSFTLRHTLQSERFALLELVFELQGVANSSEIAHWKMQESEIEEIAWFSFEELAGLEGILERHRILLTDVLRHP